MPPKITLRSQIRISSITHDGVLDIIKCLKEGYLAQTDQIPINISIIAPPKYMISTVTIKPKLGKEVL